MTKINHESDNKYQMHTQLDLQPKQTFLHLDPKLLLVQKFICFSSWRQQFLSRTKNSNSSTQVLSQTHTEGFNLASVKYLVVSSVNVNISHFCLKLFRFKHSELPWNTKSKEKHFICLHFNHISRQIFHYKFWNATGVKLVNHSTKAMSCSANYCASKTSLLSAPQTLAGLWYL